MAQTWYNLLFMHWSLAPDQLRPRVPASLELDTFGGQAWLAVVPFGMTDIHLRGVPAVPGTAATLELNVRTYVRVGDRPGVYFFSLDAANPLLVTAARVWYHLPYYWSDMRMSVGADDWITYRSRRRHPGPASAELALRYRPAGPVYRAAPGSLEAWLTERYCLYTVHSGRICRGEIHHRPWPLQGAEAEVGMNSMTAPIGLGSADVPNWAPGAGQGLSVGLGSGPRPGPALPDTQPLLHFARRLEMVAWAIEAVAH